MILFSTIMVNMPITCSLKFFLPLLVAICDVAFEIHCFFHQFNVVFTLKQFHLIGKCGDKFHAWCHHWSMDSYNLHSCLSSLEMLIVNSLVLYYLNNNLNFFLHVLNVFVNVGIVATMQACNFNHTLTHVNWNWRQMVKPKAF
jgi:hypothetical protein